MEIIFTNKKAVIFDMDGVLVDSEKLWKKAEHEIFSSLGANVTEDLTTVTQSMTTDQVIEFWYSKFPWKNKSSIDVEKLVVERVIQLIETSDCCISGIKQFIECLRLYNFKIGLATNSPKLVIPSVLQRTQTTNLFDVILSANDVKNGKPHPEIYLKTAEKLNILPIECLVIEDSLYGIKAAKSAGMYVAEFTNGYKNTPSEAADYIINFFDCSLIN